MTNLQLKIIKRAVALRVAAGEDIDTILASYPKLAANEAEEIRNLYI